MENKYSILSELPSSESIHLLPSAGWLTWPYAMIPSKIVFYILSIILDFIIYLIHQFYNVTFADADWFASINGFLMSTTLMSLLHYLDPEYFYSVFSQQSWMDWFSSFQTFTYVITTETNNINYIVPALDMTEMTIVTRPHPYPEVSTVSSFLALASVGLLIFCLWNTSNLILQ